MQAFSLPLSSVNGVITDAISLRDRGLAYGDGLFETLLINERGVSPLWGLHRQRLERSLERLSMPASNEWWRLLETRIVDLIKLAFPCVSNDLGLGALQNCVLKMIVTRGVGGRGYQLPQPLPDPSVILQLMPLPSLPNTVRLCAVPVQLSRNASLAGMKHLNKLEYVLAASHAMDGCEPVLSDTDGWVVESLSKNLFLELNGVIVTPSLDFSGVSGVQRAALIAVLGADVQIKNISERDFVSASAVVATNALAGMLPVKSYIPTTDHSRERIVIFQDSESLVCRLRQRLASVDLSAWQKCWLLGLTDIVGSN